MASLQQAWDFLKLFLGPLPMAAQEGGRREKGNANMAGISRARFGAPQASLTPEW